MYSMSSEEDEKRKERHREAQRRYEERHKEEVRERKKLWWKKERKIRKMLDIARRLIREEEGLNLSREKVISLLFYYYGFIRFGSKRGREGLEKIGLRDPSRIHPSVLSHGQE